MTQSIYKLIAIIGTLLEEYIAIIKHILSRLNEQTVKNEEVVEDNFTNTIDEILPDIFDESEKMTSFSSIPSKINNSILLDRSINMRNTLQEGKKVKENKQNILFKTIEKIIRSYKNTTVRDEVEPFEYNTAESLESYIAYDTILSTPYVDFNIHTKNFTKYEKAEFFAQILKGADSLDISQAVSYQNIIIKNNKYHDLSYTNQSKC